MTFLFNFYVCCNVFVTVLCYSDDFSDGYHYSRAFPQEVMVDVINNFGLSLLEAHNEGNENNIALSPYGATSVLVALGEGIRGYAIKEIQEATRIPLDVSVIRVGLRDIHRHLKSYFIPKEGFLAGLTLSNEKVPLISRYEEVLRFYGYDLESFNNPLYPNEDESTPAITTNTTTITMPTTTSGTNEITLQGSDMTTTETLIPDSVESRFESTEVSNERTTISPRDESTVASSLISNAPTDMSTSIVLLNITTPLIITTEEVVTATLIQTTPNTTTMQSILLTTESFSTTPKKPLTTELSTNIDSSASNSNVENIVTSSITEPPPTMTETTTLQSIVLTTESISTTSERALTTELIVNADSSGSDSNVENIVISSITEAPLTITTNSQISAFTTTKLEENLSTSATTTTIMTSPNEESSNIATSLETTTFKSEQALEISDMIQNNTFTKIPHSETFSTTNYNAELLETTIKSEQSLIPTGLLMDDNLIYTTLESTSKMMQNELGLSTITEPEISSTVASSSDVTITTENNVVDSTKINNFPESNNSSEEIENTESTSTLKEDSTDDIMISTSVAQTTSRITTTFETSSSTSTGIAETETTSIINAITTFGTEDATSSTDQEVTSSGNIDVENSTETTFLTINDSNLTDVEINNIENLTEIPGNESIKRGARSIIDYVIARYYDNFPRRNYDQRSYRPEEKLSFLVYGRVRETNINFMTYDAVLPIAYIPLINALALSFPLDSKEYYLLLLLPIDETGINKLIYDVKRRTSLRNIINSLRYAHVNAIIPSFMLKGYVILTPTLQKLGVRRIFEPRHTDFSLMTKERDIYVTNIEQAVTVKIRNYVDPDNLPNYRNLQQYRPIEFKADHPFLYFVMDSDIHVNLMAGKIVNPLNSRIR